MKHMSAKEAYNDLSDRVSGYDEFEFLTYTVHHALANKLGYAENQQVVQKREKGFEAIQRAEGHMLDSGPKGSHVHIQGDGDKVHCRLAVEHLEKCKQILSQIENMDWSEHNQLRDELFNRDPDPVRAADRLISICEEVSRKSLDSD